MSDMDSYTAGYRDGTQGSPPKSTMRKPYPGLFACMYPRLVERAREKGYALAVHGSMARDLDLIAAPWTDDAVSADDLAASILDLVGGIAGDDFKRQKPHGRLAYSIHLGGGPYIDMSVMPRKETQ